MQYLLYLVALAHYGLALAWWAIQTACAYALAYAATYCPWLCLMSGFMAQFFNGILMQLDSSASSVGNSRWRTDRIRALRSADIRMGWVEGKAGW